MSEVERLIEEFKEFVGTEIAYHDRGWEFLDEKIAKIVAAARAEGVQEGIRQCDTKCREVAHNFYKDSLNKDPDDRRDARFQHDGASACAKAVRSLAEAPRPELCPVCKGARTMPKPHWMDGHAELVDCSACDGTGVKAETGEPK